MPQSKPFELRQNELHLRMPPNFHENHHYKMKTFKVQRIRSCVQCGTVLGLKCKSCVVHPERKPKVIEYFGWPKILNVCPCKCSVQISCQRDGCKQTMWRNKTHTAGGLSRSATLFCSPKCNCLVLAAERDTRISVPCGWVECKEMVLRQRSHVKEFKAAYCHQEHYFLAMRKSAHDAKQAELGAKNGTDGKALMECLKCKDITDHQEISENVLKCQKCGTIRTSRINISKAAIA